MPSFLLLGRRSTGARQKSRRRRLLQPSRARLARKQAEWRRNREGGDSTQAFLLVQRAPPSREFARSLASRGHELLLSTFGSVRVNAIQPRVDTSRYAS